MNNINNEKYSEINYTPLICEILSYAEKITGAKLCINLYEPIFHIIVSPENVLHYCAWCRMNINNDAQRCTDYDHKYIPEKLKKEKNVIVQKCHAGVTEAIIPIFKNNRLAAKIFLGQCRTSDDIAPDDNVISRFSENQHGELINLYKKLPAIDVSLLKNTADLISLIINSIINNSDLYSIDNNDENISMSYVVKVKKYINVHLQSHSCSVKNAVKYSGISHEYLSRLFKKYVGKTIREYINFVRIERAKLLLLNSDISIAEIADRCGYNEPNYFSRVFKQMENISPGKYRNIYNRDLYNI